MGVINSPLVEGGVFSEEVNKKEVTVNRITKRVCGYYNIAHSFCYNIFIVIYRKLYSSL